MKGQMTEQPLLISGLLRHTEACRGDTEIVEGLPHTATGKVHRLRLREAHATHGLRPERTACTNDR